MDYSKEYQIMASQILALSKKSRNFRTMISKLSNQNGMLNTQLGYKMARNIVRKYNLYNYFKITWTFFEQSSFLFLVVVDINLNQRKKIMSNHRVFTKSETETVKKMFLFLREEKALKNISNIDMLKSTYKLYDILTK